MASNGGFIEELMRNWESLRQGLGSHCLKLAVYRYQLGSSWAVVSIVFFWNFLDQVEQTMLQLLPITPFMNLCLYEIGISADQVPQREVLPWHDIVSTSQLQTRAEVTASVSKVDEFFCGYRSLNPLYHHALLQKKFKISNIYELNWIETRYVDWKSSITLHMFGGQRVQPWEDEVKSWWGKILSLPSSSTKLGLVLISEKQSITPRCFRIVSIKKRFASLTIFKSHLE